MQIEHEVRDFLMTRRARITPDRAGLPYVAGHGRRVAGLRREEVAMLAGLSVEYYTRMERGKIGGASEGVLDAIARVLQLDADERAHLADLARNVAPSPRRKPSAPASPITPSVQQVLDSMTVPAVVQNERLDVLAANGLGRALYSPLFEGSQRPNFARFVFLDTRAEDFYTNVDDARDLCVAVLRATAGRDPLDQETTHLIGELSTRSADSVHRPAGAVSEAPGTLRPWFSAQLLFKDIGHLPLERHAPHAVAVGVTIRTDRPLRRERRTPHTRRAAAARAAARVEPLARPGRPAALPPPIRLKKCEP